MQRRVSEVIGPRPKIARRPLKMCLYKKSLSFSNLSGYLPGIDNGDRMNLCIPLALGNGEGTEHCETGILPASTAVVVELLRVDLNLIECIATRNPLFVFIEALLAPHQIAGGKFGVIFENTRKRIEVLTRNIWLNSVHAYPFLEMVN